MRPRRKQNRTDNIHKIAEVQSKVPVQPNPTVFSEDTQEIPLEPLERKIAIQPVSNNTKSNIQVVVTEQSVQKARPVGRPKVLSRPKSDEGYRKNEPVSSLDELQGQYLLVVNYMCRLLRESCKIPMSNPEVVVRQGQLRQDLRLSIPSFKSVIQRLKKRNVILGSKQSKDRRTITYTISRSIYASYLK